MDNCVINSLPQHDEAHALIPDSTIIIQTIWNDESVVFELYATGDKIGLYGTLLNTEQTSTANALELEIAGFMAESKNALCSPNGLPNFTYILQSNTFKFCKASEGFRITYGEVHLEQRHDIIDRILVNSMKSNATKDQQIQQLRTDMARMDDTFNEMKIALEKCVAEKLQMENELLTKFAALLNAKKGKILELQRAIKDRSSIDEYESDGSVDSDMDYSSQTYVREKQPLPSTSIDQSAAVVVIPKRSKPSTATTANEIVAGKAIVDADNSRPAANNATESMDIYDRETEVMLDDM